MVASVMLQACLHLLQSLNGSCFPMALSVTLKPSAPRSQQIMSSTLSVMLQPIAAQRGTSPFLPTDDVVFEASLLSFCTRILRRLVLRQLYTQTACTCWCTILGHAVEIGAVNAFAVYRTMHP